MDDPKVLNVIGSYDGCAMWRVVKPIDTLIGYKYPCAWRLMDSVDIDKQTEVADIVVMGRIYWMPGHEDEMNNWFRCIHNIKKRRRVICEIDDDVVTEESTRHTAVFHGPNSDNPWEEGDAEKHRQANIEAFKRADAVMVTNQQLANLVTEYTGTPTYVVPNSIPWRSWRKVWNQKRDDLPNDKLIIGWAGGFRIKDDLEPMVDAWKIIAERYSNVHFVLAGTMHDEYRNALPEDRRTYRPWIHPNVYPYQYAGFDIACCPLADVPFNHMKTPCKAFEAGAAECAVVASPTVYGDVIMHNRNGMIARTVEEWVDALSLYIEDAKTRKQHSQRWSKEVEKKHNLDKNCWQWVHVWRQVYNTTPRDISHLLESPMDVDTLSRQTDLVAV